MITKMSESPTSTSSPPTSSFQLSQSTSLQSPFCSSPRGNVTTEPRKKEGSPRSPTQESLSQKRSRNRQAPYTNNKSPSGSCCSSSDESNENDVEILTVAESRAKRLQANSRERKRMHTVNSAFDQLRELVPTYPSNRKLSKIDTLRLACTYIQDLVAVLHQTRTMQGLQGEDLTQFPVYGDGYLPGPYSSCFSVKTEATMAEFPGAFTNYRMPSTCITPNCDSDYNTSETETNSPPFLPPTSHSTLPGIGVRPPPLSRTSSDSVAHIHRQMAHATVSVNGSQMHSQATQRQITIPSPLATHSVHHGTPPLVSSELGVHQSPPVWQRCGSMPSYPVYGQ